MIEAQDLTKIYGGKAAVDHLSFTVEPGRVTGFLGPNGAGKSTTMRLILGLDRPQSGFALINGRPYRDLKDPLHTVGALLEAKSVHPGRSARNHLLFLAQTQGRPRTPGSRGLLRAEWTKIRSVRSTVWTLVIFVVVCIGFTALIAWLTESNWFGPRAAARDVRVLSNPVGFILGTWDRAGAAGHRRPGRAGHHQRVLDRGDPRLAAGRAAPATGAGRQGGGVRRSPAGGDGDRGLLLVLRRFGHPARPRAGGAGRPGRHPRRDRRRGCTSPCWACSRWPSAP